jgi:hypothetical protein
MFFFLHPTLFCNQFLLIVVCVFAASVVLGRGLRDLPGARPGREPSGVRGSQAADAAAAAAVLQQRQEQPAVPQRAQRAGARRRRHGASSVGAVRRRQHPPAVGEQPGGVALLLHAQPHQGQLRERAAAGARRLRRQPALAPAPAPTPATPPAHAPQGRRPRQAAQVPLNSSITCKYCFFGRFFFN